MAGYLKVCMIAEGCYPYVVGGVSSWIHSLIKSFPDIEFILVSIVANRSWRGKFVYELPENLTEVHEMYLEDDDWVKKQTNKRADSVKMNDEVYRAMRSLVLDQKIDWDTLFHFFQKPNLSLNDLLMGEDFFYIVKDCYNLKYNQVVFSDFLWTMRSIYLPLFHTLKMSMPKADVYHCVATGYAGVLGSMGKERYGGRLLISEHGIYTREREEELVKAQWVKGIYKNIWIEQFRKMSKLAYDRSNLVTSLYEHARELQIELGCPEGKTRVTPNGINVEGFDQIPGKTEEDAEFINVGAVLRVTPIKDVKTMIQAFSFAKDRQPKLKLWIMGPYDEDKEYAEECFDLVDMMQLTNVVFTGRINVREYLGRMDFTILTSISEGQPLTILESFAAKKPVVATDVGNCRGLLYGESDDFGEAGILTHIMNIQEIAQAMVELANNQERRIRMGENGYRRLMNKYKLDDMRQAYDRIYTEFEDSFVADWGYASDMQDGYGGPAERYLETEGQPQEGEDAWDDLTEDYDRDDRSDLGDDADYKYTGENLDASYRYMELGDGSYRYMDFGGSEQYKYEETELENV